MKKFAAVGAFCISSLLGACETVDDAGFNAPAAAPAVGNAGARVKVSMTSVSEAGIGKEVGTLVLSDSRGGLRLEPALSGLPPGPHGIHVHENGDCGVAMKEGKPVAAGAAGGHYDARGTQKHAGPHGDGHTGDLPVLIVDRAGNATNPINALRLSLSEVKGKAIVIHRGGDNFSDHPKPLGGGGERIACGVISVKS